MNALPPCALDHLVVTAPTLDIGADWVQERLGVTLRPGGEHPAMGTHNRLLRLGESSYLEVIAVNPAAGKPQRPRWFGLDRLMPDSPPRLAAWVARTADIESTFFASVEPLGTILPMRRGDLAWRISVPNDGDVIFGGIVPMLIEWQTRTHPASRLPASGCDLEALEGLDPDIGTVGGVLYSLRAETCLTLNATDRGTSPGLLARIRTPGGIRTLGSA